MATDQRPQVKPSTVIGNLTEFPWHLVDPRFERLYREQLDIDWCRVGLEQERLPWWKRCWFGSRYWLAAKLEWLVEWVEPS